MERVERQLDDEFALAELSPLHGEMRALERERAVWIRRLAAVG